MRLAPNGFNLLILLTFASSIHPETRTFILRTKERRKNNNGSKSSDIVTDTSDKVVQLNKLEPSAETGVKEWWLIRQSNGSDPEPVAPIIEGSPSSETTVGDVTEGIIPLLSMTTKSDFDPNNSESKRKFNRTSGGMREESEQYVVSLNESTPIESPNSESNRKEASAPGSVERKVTDQETEISNSTSHPLTVSGTGNVPFPASALLPPTGLSDSRESLLLPMDKALGASQPPIMEPQVTDIITPSVTVASASSASTTSKLATSSQPLRNNRKKVDGKGTGRGLPEEFELDAEDIEYMSINDEKFAPESELAGGTLDAGKAIPVPPTKGTTSVITRKATTSSSTTTVIHALDEEDNGEAEHENGDQNPDYFAESKRGVPTLGQQLYDQDNFFSQGFPDYQPQLQPIARNRRLSPGLVVATKESVYEADYSMYETDNDYERSLEQDFSMY